MKQHTFTFRCFPPQSTKSEVFLFTKLKTGFTFTKYINCISNKSLRSLRRHDKSDKRQTQTRCFISITEQSAEVSLAFVNPQYVHTRQAQIDPPEHP